MNKINQIFKLTISGILALIIILILKFNYSLYYNPQFKTDPVSKQKYNHDVYNQLNHLKGKLRNGAAGEMQSIYPEGFIFINALYGLTWTTLLSNQPEESELFEEGIQEISWAVKELQSPEAKDIFDEELPLKYGAFYRGWTNYLLGNKLKLQSSASRDEKDVEEFNKTCEEISRLLQNNYSPYIESYENRKWPADGIIAVSTLKLYDEVFNSTKYKAQLLTWIGKVKKSLDKKTGLIPHYIEAGTDSVIEGARGSSQSLILNFIKYIDEEFSKDQFEIYKSLFLDWRLGMPGIREYPKGTKGNGDIDSGPVLLDIGGAASIVGQRTMGFYGENVHYIGLRNCIESFGMSLTFGSKKKYLFGVLPMADAFIAWSNSIELSEALSVEKENWRTKAHLLSLALLIVILGIMYKI